MERNWVQEFLEDAREDLHNIAFNDTNLIIIQNSIAQWLSQKQELDANIKHRYEAALKNKELRNIIQADGEADLSRKGLNRLIRNYIKGRQQVENITSREDIVNLFKNGYELIHRIRESFVGREITYRIQYTPDSNNNKKGTLYEVNLTLEQLLPAVSLKWEGQTDVKNKQELTNAGNLFITNSKIKKVVADLKKNQQIVEGNLAEISGEKRELWDSMVEVRNKMISNNELNKYASNFGRLYEVFNLLTRTVEYRTIDTIHKPPEKNTEGLFIARLNEASRDRIPGWQAGDLGWDQLKSVFNSSAGLIGNSSIEKTLKEIQIALMKDHKTEMAEALKQIFATPQGLELNTKLDQDVYDVTTAAIDKMVANLRNVD